MTRSRSEIEKERRKDILSPNIFQNRFKRIPWILDFTDEYPFLLSNFFVSVGLFCAGCKKLVDVTFTLLSFPRG
jgi:hypothetical protein